MQQSAKFAENMCVTFLCEHGRIADSFFSLVNPETHFDYFNTQLTGISTKTVQGAPNFAVLWKQIEPIMSSGILVAHNAVFDMGLLKKCLHDYGIMWKNSAKYICTVQAGGQRQPGLCGILAAVHKKRRGCKFVYQDL